MKLRKSLVKQVMGQKNPAIIAGGITEQHVIIIITCCSVVPPEKITRKASDSDMAEKNLQL